MRLDERLGRKGLTGGLGLGLTATGDESEGADVDVKVGSEVEVEVEVELGSEGKACEGCSSWWESGMEEDGESTAS